MRKAHPSLSHMSVTQTQTESSYYSQQDDFTKYGVGLAIMCMLDFPVEIAGTKCHHMKLVRLISNKGCDSEINQSAMVHLHVHANIYRCVTLISIVEFLQMSIMATLTSIHLSVPFLHTRSTFRATFFCGKLAL